ncbi:NAD(P)-dependent dehydrogenase (short-subunit alcohol dehydrogenase family) [Streptomyces sp. LBL]|nr:NAD(P)-dependent dehydrogenase (short-subunit alcohol dehydrogenase family) [Streptomyces sp. LBL]
MNPTYNFTGKVAFVTGASFGMGLATARAFAESGAAVASPTSTKQPSTQPRRISPTQAIGSSP